MLGPGHRRRLRPSLKSLGLSLLVCPSALYIGWLFFGYYFYVPLLASLAVALALAWFRMRGVSASLPEPYGKGRTTTIDADAAARSGLLVVLAGILSSVGLMGTVFFLPADIFFVVVVGLMAGLPMNEIVFFALVARIERKCRSRIFSVTDETSQGGKDVLAKSVELARD
jgi:hypothetical protein